MCKGYEYFVQLKYSLAIKNYDLNIFSQKNYQYVSFGTWKFLFRKTYKN